MIYHRVFPAVLCRRHPKGHPKLHTTLCILQRILKMQQTAQRKLCSVLQKVLSALHLISPLSHYIQISNKLTTNIQFVLFGCCTRCTSRGNFLDIPIISRCVYSGQNKKHKESHPQLEIMLPKRCLVKGQVEKKTHVHLLERIEKKKLSTKKLKTSIYTILQQLIQREAERKQ